MIAAGFFVALCMLVTLAKLPWRGKLFLTSHPLTADLSVFIVLTAIHWGTFTGVMAATIGALMCSAILSIARWMIGRCVNGRYIPGKFDISGKLHA